MSENSAPRRKTRLQADGVVAQQDVVRRELNRVKQNAHRAVRTRYRNLIDHVGMYL